VNQTKNPPTQRSTENKKIAIRAKGIRKNFGHLEALRGADLELRSGEILALIGDNGAGKSTLAKIICGALTKDAGDLIFWDEKIDVQSIHHAHELGVYTVYQDLSLAPDLSVTDNLYLGREIILPGIRGWFGALDRKKMQNESKEALAELGIGLKSMAVRTSALSGGERQALAVARAVTWATNALLMDEPTAALGTRQSAIVYATMRAAANRGLAVLVISHDIPKMLEIADRISIMRHGVIIDNVMTSETDLRYVIELMLGGKGDINEN
jgi:simple sugar transport system ATP-binding protein